MAPEVARRIAQDAFLSGVFYDGKDLRQLLRWSRNIPVEVAIALELGPPPDFDGLAASTAATAFAPSSTTSSRAPLGGPRPTPT